MKGREKSEVERNKLFNFMKLKKKEEKKDFFLRLCGFNLQSDLLISVTNIFFFVKIFLSSS